MTGQTYQVIQSIDEIDSDIINSITKQCKIVLSSLKTGQIFESNSFVKIQMPKFCGTKEPRNIANIGYRYLREGKRIGILADKTKDQEPIRFEDFLHQESVQYWLQQLSNTRYKNLKINRKLCGTQETYAYQVWKFNNWLYSKEMECHRTRQIDEDVFKQITEKITLTGIEHLLELHKTPNSTPSDFIKMIKRYLLDPINSKKKASYVSVIYSAIMSYFEKNDFPLFFKFDPKKKFDSRNEIEPPTFGLEDYMKLLTVGRPSLTEKTVFLCKFHRGLDASTLADRFNFQAWKQLADYFGTEQHLRWDLEKCPVPITLTRIKTNFRHVGFLDYDAIKAIQDYLDYRYSKTGKIMTEDQPLFINKFAKPVNTAWISSKFFKLAQRAGLQKVVNSESNEYAFGSHELRDLLKSTLIFCGVRIDVADHCIGHMPKDSYEKQTVLFPENLRDEFCKASSKINIFSNLSVNMKKSVNVQVLQNEVVSLREEVKRLIQKDTVREQIIPVNSKELNGLRLI